MFPSENILWVDFELVWKKICQLEIEKSSLGKKSIMIKYFLIFCSIKVCQKLRYPLSIEHSVAVDVAAFVVVVVVKHGFR